MDSLGNKRQQVFVLGGGAGRRAKEAAFREAELRRLRETDAFKTQLLNTAAHELNTPITPLRLQVHLLESGTLGSLTEPQAKAIDILSRNIQRISVLVADILDVARLQSDKLRLTRARVHLDDVVEDVMESFQAAAEQVDIKLGRSGQKGIILQADPDRLVQVLYNLISNALKFTPAGGMVNIDTQETSHSVAIQVTDTGVGLTKAQIKTLFQPFSQAHDPKEFSATGTGLGLHISKGIVESHGGRIGCQSDGPGEGCRFTVALPKGNTEPEQDEPTRERDDTRLDPMVQRIRELI